MAGNVIGSVVDPSIKARRDAARAEGRARVDAGPRFRAAPGAIVPAIAVQPVAPDPNAPTAAEVTTESPVPVALGAPASFASYPLRLFLGDAWVEGRVVNREVSIEHGHRWRVELLAPRLAYGLRNSSWCSTLSSAERPSS